MKFPTRWLLIPPLIPLSITAIFGIGEMNGVQWNIHGGAALLFLFLILSSIGFLFTGLIFVPSGLRQLIQDSNHRTAKNISCFVFSATCWIAAISVGIYTTYAALSAPQ